MVRSVAIGLRNVARRKARPARAGRRTGATCRQSSRVRPHRIRNHLVPQDRRPPPERSEPATRTPERSSGTAPNFLEKSIATPYEWRYDET